MSNGMIVNGTKLPFLTDRQFAEEAQILLAGYGQKFKPVLNPPIPIDEIVECYLELSLDFLDMKELFKVDDVHGALWVNERRVGIDQSLEPETFPSMLGRYRFTLAHEAAHWQLHRRLFQNRAANQLNLLSGDAKRPEYICRTSDRKVPIEFQADAFAAHLLMPESLVRRCWHELRGSSEPMSLDQIRKDGTAEIKADIQRRLRYMTGSDAEDRAAMESAAQPMADTFEVSASAMKNRLMKLNLLVKHKEKSLFDGME